jgi:hypothetical protein
MKTKFDNNGVSLALTIGLLLVLVLITVTVNELVIRALRASHQIESSDKAYFSAEAGVEDALYELSTHSAGYETDPLGDPNVRNADFTETVDWNNEWEIANRGLNTCDNSLATWEAPFSPTYCGRLFAGEKLVLNMFTDDALSVGINTNEINITAADINSLTVNSITVKIRLPLSTVSDNASAFAGIPALEIDNDGDYNSGTGTGLNEDGHVDFGYASAPCPYSGGVNIDDDDCDGREDEDSPEDPVILWRLIDGSGNSFQPLRSCKGDPDHFSHAGDANAILCEKNFTLVNNELSVSLDELDKGVDQSGNIQTLQAFLGAYAGLTETVQMEILIAAPMEAIDAGNASKIPIPYLEYGVEYDAGIGIEIPSTFFSIKSDGFYRDFKQSITTNVVPRATTRLLDLTIIQQ